MDPALRELAERGDPEEEIEAILRLEPDSEGPLPEKVRQVSGFSDIRTIRLKRKDIPEVWSAPGVASIKAPRILEVDAPSDTTELLSDEVFQEGDEGFSGLFGTRRNVNRRPPDRSNAGRGTVIGVIDWGFDFAHKAFRNVNGTTRIRAIWDQRGSKGKNSPRFGYGRVLDEDLINRALRSSRPYEALDYHPGDADSGIGAHGTHVADVAAGTTRPGGGGMAPEAELVFVHLASEALSGLANLGDSVRLLEAIDFIADVAGNSPFVINMSVGRHGGPHSGLTLVEQAFDRFLEAAPDRLIVQSAGNYHLSRAHASGWITPGGSAELYWVVGGRDPTPNELEIWYSDRDKLDATLYPPGSDEGFAVALGESRGLYKANGGVIGKLYHRAYDPNSPDHHIEIFLGKSAPAGRWKLELQGNLIEDGRFHAWIERDKAGRKGQSRFLHGNFNQISTIGSICNGFLPLAVGAVDDRRNEIKPAPFASGGPTRDGRMKPDIVGPGMMIRAARSAPRGARKPTHLTTVMSGASQAAPFVAGIGSCLLSDFRRPMPIHEIRPRMFRICEHLTPRKIADSSRLGAGIIQPEKHYQRSLERSLK